MELATQLQALFLERGLTLATAESCTGGLVAHTVTEVAGSSGYLRGGIVAYADEAKERLLDVPHDVLDAHGAVSAQVARAMADGAAARFTTDVSVAVTGVAGPGGGSPAKPVGLTYVAVTAPSTNEVRRFLWTGDRAANKRACCSRSCVPARSASRWRPRPAASRGPARSLCGDLGARYRRGTPQTRHGTRRLPRPEAAY
ncbi:MAG: CinA family protein [Chloroflexi bacterium]|nr:MAG: CinA family protein [Chloroflexota bacterium]